ncbi:hypothetical protein HIM_10374 [Hirsutella minnesotensis 3608]|uniref:Protein kinase domain-containing protein n=1 Tax=Hirsutella minnesotensis 3608 TaxID=1043627 RepID=A0A0F7ZG40_9HYPO|nr:hypothetical protein HIM_10374 [Hirsutella minnesotensis 3608]
MASIIRWARALTRTAPLVPLRFPASGFTIVDKSVLLEEENLEGFSSGQYFPVNIGDVYVSKYQVLGKLGFGTTSTVWLARNLASHSHVALKVYTKDSGCRDEFQTLKAIGSANTSHPGHRGVQTALDLFKLKGPQDDHYCLVLNPMWESWKHLLRRNDSGRFSVDLLKAGLRHLFRALDYLHTEYIKADNILHDIVDKKLLSKFIRAELNSPSDRKVVNGTTVYASRTFDLPRKFGEPVLCDFGSAVKGDVKRNHDAQPAVYRSPEVMIKTGWSYPVDIWNVGVMIWDIFQGRHLFYGQDAIKKTYTTRAHLAEVVAVLGPPPLDFLQRGIRSREFFSEEGKWIASVDVPPQTNLENCVAFLEGDEKAAFLNLVRGMLQWRPEDRKTAKELTQDPWINRP